MMISVLIPFKSDHGQRDKIFNWILRRYQKLLPDAQICIGSNDDEPFNRGKARNDAFEKSTGAIILIADADTIFHNVFLDDGISLLENGAPWVIPYEVYYNMTSQDTRAVLGWAPPGMTIAEPEDYEHRLIDSVAGLLLLRRKDFIPYDPGFIGWSYEDRAEQYLLDVNVGQHVRVPGYVLHLWHSAPYETTFGQPYANHNLRLYNKIRGIL